MQSIQQFYTFINSAHPHRDRAKRAQERCNMKFEILLLHVSVFSIDSHARFGRHRPYLTRALHTCRVKVSLHTRVQCAHSSLRATVVH